MSIAEIVNLKIPEEFGADEDSYDTEAIGYVESQVQLFAPSAQFYYGCTQFVIAGAVDNKVVKIPFDGRIEYNSEYDEETDTYTDTSYFNHYDTDYCKKSYELYKEAEKAGIDPIFAKMELLETPSTAHTDFYLQEEVICFDSDADWRDRKNYSKDSYVKAEEKQKDRDTWMWREFPIEWLATAIECYGLALVENFIYFCKDNCLDDWHDGNYGWRKDGSPVVLDWAGFDF